MHLPTLGRPFKQLKRIEPLLGDHDEITRTGADDTPKLEFGTADRVGADTAILGKQHWLMAFETV